MLTVLLSLGAAIGWGFHDFLIQPATRRVGAFAALFWVLLVSTAVLMTVALAMDGLPHGGAEWRAVGIAAGGGITYVFAVASLFHALEIGKLSLVTPLVALMGGLAAIVAIMLGERISVYAAIALPLAVGGAVLASIVREGPGGEGDPPFANALSGGRPHAVPGAGWALLSALLFGTTFLLYGSVGDVSAVSAAGWGRLTGLLLFLPFALFKVDLAMPKRVYWRTTLCAILDSGAYVAMAAATARGPLAIASALMAQFATVALILALVVRRERPTRAQLFGIVCTIVAVVFFALAT